MRDAGEPFTVARLGSVRLGEVDQLEASTRVSQRPL